MLKPFISLKTLGHAIRIIADHMESRKSPDIVCGCSNCECGIPHVASEVETSTYELSVTDLDDDLISHWKLTKKGRLKPVFKKKVKTVNDIDSKINDFLNYIRTIR